MTTRALVLTISLLVGTAGVSIAGELVPYKESSRGEESIADMFEEKYGEEANPTSYLSADHWNAFRYFQSALMEMMVEPQSTQKSRESHRNLPTITDDPNFVGPQPVGWTHLYWNRGYSDARQPLADDSGFAVSSHTMPSELGMEGKSFYMPDKSILDKLVAIMERQREIGARIPPNATQADEQYWKDTDALEQEFLQAVAAELPGIREAVKTGGQDVFALGYKYDENGNLLPLTLNVDMIESQLRMMGVKMPDDSAQGQGDGAGGPGVDTASADGPPVIEVRQPPETVKQLNRDYERFVEGFSDEASRTRAEIELDMFRMRVRPEDVQPGVKSYDPLMTPEYQTGGLNLPSNQPGGE